MNWGDCESNPFFTLQEIAFLQSKKRSARMHTAAYKVDVASDRRRCENVPRHILCALLCFYMNHFYRINCSLHQFIYLLF